jgi:hypothetical protein
MQQQISGGAPPPSSLQILSMVVTWVISVAAFALASYSLYLQRRDRRPRLTVEPQLTLRKINLTHDDLGFTWDKDDFCMVLTLRNPTEKDIQVEEVSFVREDGKVSKVTPWQNLPLVPSHKTAEVIIQLEKLVAPMGGKTKSIGHFVIRDVLGNVSKSGEAFYDIADRQKFFPSEDEYNMWVVGYKPVDN